jgi:hypothetical protein
MEWTKFACNKNSDDPKLHQEYLRGGITLVQQSSIKTMEIQSNSIKQYQNLFEKEIGPFLHFTILLDYKIACDLLSFKLLQNKDDYTRFAGTGKYLLNYNNEKRVVWESDSIDPLHQVKQGVQLTVQYDDGDPILYFTLQSYVYSSTGTAKYDELWDYCVMACTSIMRTIELRIQNLVDASKFLAISRGVRGTTFDDIFSDTNRENAFLFQVYIENEKYLRFIQKELAGEPGSFLVDKNKNEKTFDLQRVVDLLKKGLLETIGFYVENNYKDT